MLENLLFSMNSTMPLFFIMLLGYVLHRTGFLSDAFVAGANKFVFYVALPVQLFFKALRYRELRPAEQENGTVPRNELVYEHTLS